MLYLFLYRLLNNSQAALLGALVFVSGYIGAENAVSAYSFITTNLSLLLLFTTLYLILQRNFVNTKGILIFAVASFALTLLAFPVRSSGYIALVIASVILFVKALKAIKHERVFLIISMSIIFGFTYFVLPVLTSGRLASVWERTGNPQISNTYLISTAHNYLETSGGYVFTDWIAQQTKFYVLGLDTGSMRIFLAVVIHLSAFLFLVKTKKRYSKKILFFSLLWIFTQYLPQSLVAPWALESTNRYVVFSFIGVIVMLSFLTTLSRKYKILVSIIIVLNLIQSNAYFESFKNQSIKRASFYLQLKSYLKEIPQDSILYFDSALVEDRQKLVDFMRVGAYSSEAAIGLELGAEKSFFKVFAGSEEYFDLLASGFKKVDLIHAYYYDGNSLSDITSQVRSAIYSKAKKVDLNHSISPQFVYDPNKKLYGSDNLKFEWKDDNLSFFSPSQVNFYLVPSVVDIPLPYTQSCFDCNYDSQNYRNVIEFLIGKDKSISAKEESYIQKIKNAPAAKIINVEDKIALTKYLQNGVPACLEVDILGFKLTQSVNIKLTNTLQKISITLPSFGNNKPKFRISCINYPLHLEVKSAVINFLPDSKD